MVMSAKRTIITTITALTLACGTAAGLAGAGPARAATPACGTSCTDVFPMQTGALDAAAVQNVAPQTGQNIILFPAAPTVAEDFTLLSLGNVALLYSAGIVGPAVGLTWPADNAYEYEYTPGNAATGLCMGVATTAANGTPVTLQPCGLTSKTVWITLSIDTIAGYQPLINGSDTITGAPYVLTAGPVKSVLMTRQLYLVAGTFAPSQMWQNINGVL
jgi:hypothetical protein